MGGEGRGREEKGKGYPPNENPGYGLAHSTQAIPSLGLGLYVLCFYAAFGV